MKKNNPRKIILPIAIMIFSLIMFYFSTRMEDTVSGTMGPGVFPSIALALMFILSAIIIYNGRKEARHKVISPYASGSTTGVFASRLAAIVSGELKEKVALKSYQGEGKYSASYVGANAKTEGYCLTFIGGDVPSKSNFIGASLSLVRYTPVLGLTADPDVLVLRGDSNDGCTMTNDSFKSLMAEKVGFDYTPDMPYSLKEVLAQKCGEEISPVYFEDTPSMLSAIHDGKVKGGFCHLTAFLDNRAEFANLEVVAVADTKRITEFPEAPTLKELGIDVVSGEWTGLGYSHNTPEDVKTQMSTILAKPEVRKNIADELDKIDARKNVISGEDFAELLGEQSRIAKECGIEYDYNEDKISAYRVLGVIAALIASVVLMNLVGYIAVAFALLFGLYVFLMPVRNTQKIVTAFIIALIFTAAVYFIFTKLFYVVFP